MTTFSGFVLISPHGGEVNPNVSAELSELDVDYWPAHESATGLVATTGGTNNRPIEIATAARTGVVAASYMDDYYHRVHVVPGVLELGNIASERVETIEVWNARFADNELEDLDAANADGMTLVGPADPPTTFKPLESRLYSLTVGLDGPPVADALYTFTFTLDTATLRVLSTRVVAWPWMPDWSTPVLERIEWATDVIQAHDGSEQRSALRLGPRKSYEFEAWFTGRDRRTAEASIYGWGAQVWALPIWPDGLDLAAPLPAGSTTIAIDTTGRDYVADGLAILTTDARHYETVEVLSATSSLVTFKRATLQDWPAGARIYPARAARLQDRAQLPRWDFDVSRMRVLFSVDEPVDYPAATGGTTYRGYPVLDRRPDWSPGLDLEMLRKLATLDPITGPVVVDDEADMPMLLQRCGFTLTSHAESDAFRRTLYRMRGRQVGAWVPTWQRDLVIVAPFLAAAVQIDIEHCAYTRQIAQGRGRRDIRIEMRDGAVFHRRIVSSEETSEDVERIAVDSALGRDVAPDDVLAVHFMMFARHESDAVELSHWTGDVCETVISYRGVRNDV